MDARVAQIGHFLGVGVAVEMPLLHAWGSGSRQQPVRMLLGSVKRGLSISKGLAGISSGSGRIRVEFVV